MSQGFANATPTTAAPAPVAVSGEREEPTTIGLTWAGGPLAADGVAPPIDPLARLGNDRTRTLLQLQRLHGNAYVQRLLARRTGQGPQRVTHDPLARLQRQSPTAPAPTEDQPLDVSTLKLEGELPGAGFDVGPRAAMAEPLLQRQPSSPRAVQANFTLTVNQPTVQIAPGAQIGAAHGRPSAVGWTTPSYDIQISPSSTASNISGTVTLDFVVELPSDYDGPRQAIVRDHEIGHVRIGERKAREHLVDGFKAALEASPTPVTVSQVRSAMQTAATNFVTAERTGSQGYDDADYPRMLEAYRGARASLATLSAQSPAIGQMARTLRSLPGRLYSSIRNYDEASLEAYAGGVTAARGALSPQEIWRLQYNQEFQSRVSNCHASVNSYLSGTGLLGTGMESLPEGMKSQLTVIQSALAAFGFSPSAASASF